MKDKVLNWLANGQVGLSSKCMALTAAGVPYYEIDHPLDPADFNRCLLLVEQIPEIESEFSRIAELSDQWRAVIGNWGAIKSSFLDEVGANWSKGDCAYKTYELMKELGL